MYIIVMNQNGLLISNSGNELKGKCIFMLVKLLP